MKKVKIDRRTWARNDPKTGEPINYYGSNNCLRHDSGSQCCLGFICNQAHRVAKRDMTGIGIPSDILAIRSKLDSCEEQFIDLNDAPACFGAKTSMQQERKIAKLAEEKLGILIVFEN